jgi:hypothetical protein
LPNAPVAVAPEPVWLQNPISLPANWRPGPVPRLAQDSGSEYVATRSSSSLVASPMVGGSVPRTTGSLVPGSRASVYDYTPSFAVEPASFFAPLDAYQDLPRNHGWPSHGPNAHLELPVRVQTE